ncbi:MAG TPA: PQQ-dependent dehydrogenase, methanol/ethanol family [Candidatus Acidoferrales bacterium]|nr:PQQ-dependent dehydrogenase, methanol/ethanol family [Candidatus Acidoferrales bacterium]
MKIRNGNNWFLIGLLALSASIAGAQQPQTVNDSALKSAAKHGEEWLTNGHDYADTRYSPLKQIDATNVKRLGLAWSYDTGSFPGTLESTPIISNGTLYVTATWSTVFAVDARTGKEKWRWDPQIGHQNFPPGSSGKPDKVRTGPSLCCGPGNRGVAIYDGKVYVGLLDARLVALDAETGKVVWDVRTAGANEDYSITGAPLIVKGKVIIGNGGGEFAVRGYISAYDAETGKLAWRTYTVPGDPSKPFESKAMAAAAKTWTGDWWKLGGGGNPWDAISYDPDLDLIYTGTAQGGPWVARYRSPKGGDNLYICSILALKPETGEQVWYFQTTPNDEWDYDAVQGLTLADLKIGGKLRKVIMQAPKNGFFYVLDRKTGKFISAAPYVKVTWAKGVDPKTGRPIEAENIHDYVKGVTVAPGAAGGHAWQAMSFNPNTGLVYLPALDSTFQYIQAPEFKPELGAYNWGIVFRPPPPPAPGQTATPPPSSRPGGFLTAWDPVTEKERWRLPMMNGGGTVTTAGNLVFAASGDGDFVALSADKGEKLWSVKLVPGFANPATYMLDGKQYVSVLAGRAGKGRVYTFVLDGKEPIPTPAAVAPPPPPPAGTAPAAPTNQNQQ